MCSLTMYSITGYFEFLMYMITMKPSRKETRTKNLQVHDPYPPSSPITCFSCYFIYPPQRYYCVKLLIYSHDKNCSILIILTIVIITLVTDKATNQNKPGNNSNQVLVFSERGKPPYSGKKNTLSEQRAYKLNPHIA